MSDDLVKRLRDVAEATGPNEARQIALDAADRIEELEAKLEELQAEIDEAWRRAAYAEEQWGRCEAKLAKAVELANLVVEFSDRALWKVAKNTVLELKGEK